MAVFGRWLEAGTIQHILVSSVSKILQHFENLAEIF